ncbi:MAG TPA: DUF1937 family protein [Deltaproteobacteria bacterium]|nr:DUF1937 family protein [Deltaproteobacteria bacterium]
MKKIYLAAPYGHKDPKVREQRVEAVNKKAAELMMDGHLVFSPLSHSHPISKHCTVDPCDNNFWLRQDLWVLEICDVMQILCLDGWKESDGIDTEWRKASTLNIPIELIYE